MNLISQKMRQLGLTIHFTDIYRLGKTKCWILNSNNIRSKIKSSFRPNSAWDSIGKTTIGKTHPTSSWYNNSFSCHFYNHCNQNIVDISSALTLSLQCWVLNVSTIFGLQWLYFQIIWVKWVSELCSGIHMILRVFKHVSTCIFDHLKNVLRKKDCFY